MKEIKPSIRRRFFVIIAFVIEIAIAVISIFKTCICLHLKCIAFVVCQTQRRPFEVKDNGNSTNKVTGTRKMHLMYVFSIFVHG